MKSQSGQAVLIVLLSMVVVLTIVLSVIAGATSDVKISGNETSSLRAFSAAESGIEKALITNLATSGNVNSGASFNATVTSLALGDSSFVYPGTIASGDAGFLWFVSHSNTGALTCVGNTCFTGRILKFCWGTPGTVYNLPTTPAIEVTVFYLTTPGNYTTVKSLKGIYDPNAPRVAANGYIAAGGVCTVKGVTFAFQAQIDVGGVVPAGSYGVQNGLQFASIKMLYNTDLPQPLAVDVNFAGNSALPTQGSKVESTGTLNQTTRKIQVIKGYNQIPPIFDSAVFSPGSIAQ